jgi:hypothetical protein
MAPELIGEKRRDQAEEFRSGDPTAPIGDGLPVKIQAVIFAIAAVAAQKWACWRAGCFA